MSHKRHSGWSGRSDDKRPRREPSDGEEIIKLLRCIDARLKRMERQGQSSLSSNQRRETSRSAPQTNAGSWTFDEPQQVIVANTRHRRKAYDKTITHVAMDRAATIESTDNSVTRANGFGFGASNSMSLMGELYPHAQSTRSNMSGVVVESILSWPCEQPIPQYARPYWGDPNWHYRNCLMKLQFNGQALKHGSGSYQLTIEFNNPQTDDQVAIDQEAAIIIGGIGFYNNGTVIAEGADWERLLSKQRQTQLPYSHGARGVPVWRAHKLSEPWEDGDVLKFKIDTNEDTVVFQRAKLPEKVLWNVLQFTNNRTSPDSVPVIVFCGGKYQQAIHGGKAPKVKVKLTIQE